MPRQARQKSQSGIYHIMLRGNERKAIFSESQDKDKLVAILLQKKHAAKASLYAFCVMNNHAHLVIKEDRDSGDSIETLMKRIGVAYATYYNQKQKRIGHVFQDRFRSEPVEDEAYLLSVIRYVHTNPVKASDRRGLAYPWSSYCWYTGEHPDPGMSELADILAIFHGEEAAARRGFCRFHQEAEVQAFLDVPDKPAGEYEPAEVLQDLLAQAGLTAADFLREKQLPAVQAVVSQFIEQTGLSLRKAAELVGINREKLRKLVVSKEPSP